MNGVTPHDRRAVARYERSGLERIVTGAITSAEVEAFERLTTRQLDLLVAGLGRSTRPSAWWAFVSALARHSLLSGPAVGWATSPNDAASFYPFMWGYGYVAPEHLGERSDVG
ncbi:hypothetical protein [Agromyces sp. LHK192]|uniref:hypothetical protein n=1 Tax=Agromyces sp. LHK192 TaxID=2498704 RepID=UPI000FD93F50|nr:hypothetical protein [Agromyces sp. LHK192]